MLRNYLFKTEVLIYFLISLSLICFPCVKLFLMLIEIRLDKMELLLSFLCCLVDCRFFSNRYLSPWLSTLIRSSRGLDCLKIAKAFEIVFKYVFMSTAV